MQMLKTATFALTAVMAMSAMAADQFGAWAKTIRDEQSWQTGRLPAIADGYKRRMDADGSDYEARVLHAATILANLGENKNVAAYAKKFGITLDYLGMKANGDFSSPSSWPAVNDMVDAFVKEGVPVLKTALQDLEGIPRDWDGSILLSTDEFPVDEDVYLDAADILYARAAIEAAIGTAYFAHGYDLTLDWKKANDTMNYRRTVQSVKRAPASGDDEIWDTVGEAADCDGGGGMASLKCCISGQKMYVRAEGGYEEIGEDGVHFIRSLYMEMEGADEEPAWGVLVTDDPYGHMQQDAPSYVARVFNKAEIGTWYYWNFPQDRRIPVSVTQTGNVCQFAIDLGRYASYAKTGMWNLAWGEACIYQEWVDEPFYDEYFGEQYEGWWIAGWCYLDCPDLGAAQLGKFITEQTKFMSKVRNASSLAMSRSWMTAAFNRALAADIAVQSRSDDLMHFIEYDSLDEEDIARARSLTEKALAALSSVQTVDVGQEVIGDRETRFDLSLLPNDGVMQIYLGALFEGRITRDLLPTLLKDANEGPVPVVETIADPTLAGLLPEFTAKTWSHILQNRGISVAHQTVTLKLDTNGGKLPKGALASISLDFDEDSEECYYPELPVPERAGFIFTGWAAAKSGGEAVHYGDAYDASLFVGAKTPTLYAQWLQLYALTVKGEDAYASWDWSDEQYETLPDEALDGEFERELDGKGVVNVPAGAVVWISASSEMEGRGGNWLTFQKWTPSSAKANLGAFFKVGESQTQFVMPAEKLTMTATYIDEATCGWLTAEAWANEVNVGWSDELGDDVYIYPPYEAFEWSPDGKTWYKSGDSALLKAGSYTVSWRSTDPRWSPPSLKEKVKVEAGDEVYPMSASFFFTYVPQVVVDVMTFENGELRKSSAGGTVAMNPKDGLVPTDKTVAMTAKANKDYAFQGWALAKYWEYGDHFAETSATWKLLNSANYCSYPATGWLNSYIDPDDGMVHVLAVFKALPDYSSDDIVFGGFGGCCGYHKISYDGYGNASITFKGVAGCALDEGELTISCGATSSPLAYKLNGKLPDGLKFDAKTGSISGEPKKPGRTTVTLVATDPAKNSKTLTVNFDIAPLPSWLAGEYRGIMKYRGDSEGHWEWDNEAQDDVWVEDGEGEPRQTGILELSVKSDGKVSAKLITRTGARSVSGALAWHSYGDEDDEEGEFSFSAKMTKDDEECDIEFSSDGTISGYADTYNKPEERYDGGDVEGLRQDTALLSKSNFMDKYYTFAFNAAASGNDEQHEASGYGYLTVKTDKKGQAKVTGQLPDGEKVSMSALVLPLSDLDVEEAVADDIAARIYVFASPSAYKKHDWFSMSLVMSSDGRLDVGEGAAWTVADIVPSGDGDYDGEHVNATVFGSGAEYSAASSLEDYYFSIYCDSSEDVTLEWSYKEGRDTFYEYAEAQVFDGFFNVLLAGDRKGEISLARKSPAPWEHKWKEDGVTYSEWDYWQDKNGNDITDPSQLSFKFTKATGIFTGSATVYFDYRDVNDRPQHKTAKLPYNGVVVLDEDCIAGYGAAVYSTKENIYDESRGKYVVTPKVVSLPVELNQTTNP